MLDLAGRIAAYASRYCMFQNGETLGVAVSGGADSVALVLLLKQLGLALHIIHVDHGLRGEESAADSSFVADLAGRLDLPVTICPGRVPEGENVEQSARQARLTAFQDLLASGAVDRVATGHTLDDQAETVLYRFLRGSHTAGLSGIRPVTSTRLIRPLLAIRRSELREFLAARGEPWREDSSNQDWQFRRNELRQNLMPQLEAGWNPQLTPVLAHHATLAQEEEEYWGALIAPLADRLLVTQRDGAVICPVTECAALPKAVLRRLLRHALQVVKSDLLQIDAAHIEASLALFFGREGHARVQIPGLDLMRSFDHVRVSRLTAPIGDRRFYEYPIAGPTTVDISDEYCISLEIRELGIGGTAAETICQYNESTAELDAEKVHWPLLLRAWRPGDVLTTDEAREAKKVKFLFQEHRIPLWERKSWPVLEDPGGILWTRQFGVAYGFSATSGTRRVLVVRESKRCPTT